MGSGPMDSEGQLERQRRRGGALAALGDFVGRRPKAVLGTWLALIAALAVCGAGLESRLSTRSVFVAGTETSREHAIVAHEFGGGESLVVLLRGEPRAVRRDGSRLVAALRALPRTFVVSPWSPRAPRGLRPRPGVAALILNSDPSQGEQPSDLLAAVEREVEASAGRGVHASIAGGPAVVSSFKSATDEAAAIGERVAIPALLIVLLLVFRSVFAAAIPLLVGGAVVGAGRGVVSLLLGLIHVEAFALGTLGMMGLALGVDYSLLVVSRFREEMRSGDDTGAAVRATVVATGRAIVPAGGGLVLAMLVVALAMPGPLIVSAATVVIAVTVLSVLSALFVVPASLALIGDRLDLLALPSRRARGGEGLSSRLSGRLATRPVLVLAMVWGMLICAALAFTLDSRVGTASLLPASNPGRKQEEEVQRALGPGWAGPFEVAIDGKGTPVTSPERLRALAAFQRRAEGDPDVTAVAGPGPIASRLSGLADARSGAEGPQGLERELASLGTASSMASRGIMRGSRGAGEIRSALGAAGHGASSLRSALGAARRGSGALEAELRRASTGSGRIAAGMGEATSGSRALASALRNARKRAAEASTVSGELIRALALGDRHLSDLQGHLTPAEEQLLTAEQLLQRASRESGDPQLSAALQAVEAARRSLTGGEPSGEGGASFAGFGTGIGDARGQFSLGLYLARRMAKSQQRSRQGVRSLADSTTRFEAGLEDLQRHSGELASGVARLAQAGGRLPSGLRRLGAGAGRLATGLASVANGAGRLAGGLATGERRFQRFSRALGSSPLGEGGGSRAGLLDLLRESPGLLRSPYLFLAGLDGIRSDRRGDISLVVNLQHGGTAARMFVIPRSAPDSPETAALRSRLQQQGAAFARKTGTVVAVGGVPADLADVNAYTRDRAPLLRIALSLITVLVLFAVTRSLTIPVLAGLLNFVTVAASFGVLSLLFGTSLLGGPGYVDALVIPAIIMVMFGLAIDYEVFLLARMREEYARTGSPGAAVANGVAKTAHVITGAALIMIVVFVAFASSEFMTLRDFGVAQAVGVAIDAFVVRLVVMPAAIRGMGRWAWWMPRRLDRFL